ncbi:MAG TPA: rRNA adenine N-6-methyltransferase family protein [Candidatus Azoamicus sp.]
MNKKKLSQNFLVDDNIKKKMLKYINISKKDIILEIGSGEGSISKDIYTLAKIFFL